MTTTLVWQPDGLNAFEHEVPALKLTLRVARDEQHRWRASTRPQGTPASYVREFQLCYRRDEAMNWCWLKVKPDALSGQFHHFIGRTTGVSTPKAGEGFAGGKAEPLETSA